MWTAARVEGLRLVADRGLAACLGLALLPAIAVVASLPDGGIVPAEALRGPVRLSLLANVALAAACFAAVRTAAAFQAGIVARDFLVLRSCSAYWMRVISSGSCGALLALASWGFAWVGTQVSHFDVIGAPALAEALLMGAGAGTWGAAIGALVRAPLAVLPIVVVSLSPALLLSALVPDAVIAFPLGSALLSFEAPIVDAPGERWWAVSIALLWLAIAVCCAKMTVRRRPLLS